MDRSRASVAARDHDLVAIEADDRSGNVVARVVGRRDRDGLAGGEALPCGDRVGAWRVAPAAIASASSLESLLGSPWPNAITRSYQAPTRVKSRERRGDRRRAADEPDRLAAAKSAIDGASPSRNDRPSASIVSSRAK